MTKRAFRSRVDCNGHKCVPSENRADFPPVLESDHSRLSRWAFPRCRAIEAVPCQSPRRNIIPSIEGATPAPPVDCTAVAACPGARPQSPPS